MYAYCICKAAKLSLMRLSCLVSLLCISSVKNIYIYIYIYIHIYKVVSILSSLYILFLPKTVPKEV